MNAAPPSLAGLLVSPRRRRLAVALWLAVAAALAAGLPRLTLDSSPEVYFTDDRAELERYRQLEVRFGRDRALRVVVSGSPEDPGDAGGLWSAEGLRWLGELEERLADLPGVLLTAGLHRRHGRAPGAWPPPDPAAFRRRAVADPVDRGAGWVAADGSAATVLVALPRLAPDEQRRVLAEAEGVLATAPPGVDAFLAGLPVVQAALEAESRALLRRFFPALVAFTAATLLVFFRRPRQVGAVLLFLAVAEAGTLGAMGWAGARLDLASMLLVPLLFVVSTATAVHLLVRFRELAGRSAGAPAAPRAAAELVRQKSWPVAWGGLTTAAGFGSLAVAPVPAVRTLGAWAAFGFLWTLLAALTLLPCLLAETGRESREGHARRRMLHALHRQGRRWAAAAAARRGTVYAVFALLAVLAAAGALRLRAESNVVSYLPADHPVRTRLAAAEDRGLGVVSADLVLALPRGGEDFRTPDRLARLAELSARLRRHPLTTGTLSAGDLVASWRRPGETGAESWQRALARGLADRGDHQSLSYLLTAGGDRTRVTLLVPMAGGRQLDGLFAAARREAAALFPQADAWVTGRYPLVVRAQRALLPTMVRSLTLAALLVAAALWLGMGGIGMRGIGNERERRERPGPGPGGSGGLALRALVANLWPVLIAVGVMGWWGVPLDSTTVAVAAVALGLVVDDTFHTFADFRRQLPRRGPRRAVVAALGRNTPAHVATAVLLVGGFALFAASGFVPAARFGPLTAVAVAAALAADLLLVPALLAGSPRRP